MLDMNLKKYSISHFFMKDLFVIKINLHCKSTQKNHFLCLAAKITE